MMVSKVLNEQDGGPGGQRGVFYWHLGRVSGTCTTLEIDVHQQNIKVVDEWSTFELGTGETISSMVQWKDSLIKTTSNGILYLRQNLFISN